MERNCSYGVRFLSSWTSASCRRGAAGTECVQGGSAQEVKGPHSVDWGIAQGDGAGFFLKSTTISTVLRAFTVASIFSRCTRSPGCQLPTYIQTHIQTHQMFTASSTDLLAL